MWKMCFGSVSVMPTQSQVLTAISRSIFYRGTVQDPKSQRGRTGSFTAGMNLSFWSQIQATNPDPPGGLNSSVLGDQVDNQSKQWT